MNYYERIQKSIDYCEENLTEEVRGEDMAKRAYMSLSSFHRIFFALTGYKAAEYIRNRRVSFAAYELKRGGKVLDTAVKYCYTSADAFARTFRSVTGLLPSKYPSSQTNYVFERINLMDKYYDSQDKILMEEYPDIKVLKELPPMKAAYFCYYGKDPEAGAFQVMSDWVNQEKLDLNGGGHRIFGYNAPGTRLGDTEYGYEVCVTIPESYEFEDSLVKTKILSGGKYIVCHVERGEDLGGNIIKSWQRLNKWIAGSRYIYDGSAQWLEEHLEFDDANNHRGGVDLYAPVAPKGVLDNDMEIVDTPPLKVYCATATGSGCENKAREQIFAWIEENKLCLEKCRIFAFYDYQKMGQEDFAFHMYVAPGEEKAELTDGEFPGGKFAVRHTKYKYNAPAWFRFIEDIGNSDKVEMDCRPFMEMYNIAVPEINGETAVTQYMPVKDQ